MEDITHCNNNEEFIQTITERFNNNHNNIKNDLDVLGIVIDTNKLKNLDMINNNKNKEILKAISSVNYRFLMESLLDYKLFALFFDKDKPFNEYINFINVLDRYYDDSIINKNNYKLILRTILHNLIKNICNAKDKFTNCEDCEAETLHFINLLLDSKNNDKYLLSNNGYMLQEVDIEYLINIVIKKLAKVEYNNKKDEEEIKRISKLILNETIMPSVKRFMFKDYLSKRLIKENSFRTKRAKELQCLLVDILPINQKVINIFNNQFSVNETVNKTINGIYNKNKTMNAFSQKMGQEPGINLPEVKKLTENQKVRNKKINSPYIVDKINSYTRNNMAFNIAKHTREVS